MSVRKKKRAFMEWSGHYGIIDGHADTVLKIFKKGWSLDGTKGRLEVDIPKMRKGKVTIQFFAIYTYIESFYQRVKPHSHAIAVLHLIALFYRELMKNAKDIMLIRKLEELGNIKKEEKIGVILSIEGGESLENDLELLKIYYVLGVRSLTLTHNSRNEIADGVGEASSGGGLTEFGLSVVREMNNLGMIIDVAHLAVSPLEEVLEVSSLPVIDSHTGCAALCNHKRNLSDRQLKALAKKGGVACICFVPGFLNSSGKATSEDVFRHIDHAVEVMGIDGVGIGSDFDGMKKLPEDIPNASHFGTIPRKLLKAGYQEEEVKKILYGNLYRVIKENWQDKGFRTREILDEL